MYTQNKRYSKAICVFTTIIFTLSLISTSTAVIVKDTLVIQIEQPIINLDNRYRSSSSIYDNMIAYQYQGYLGMIAPGETLVTLSGVAESYSVNEEGNEWTFTLREGARLHDGSVIDAKTVRYSMIANWMAYYEYDNISYALTQWESSGYNVTFPSSDPNGNGLVVTFSGESVSDPKFPFDISGAWNGLMLVPYGIQGTYTDSTITCRDKLEAFKESPISCGPYKFVEHVSEDYVLLERFDDWFGWGMTFFGSNGVAYTFPDNYVSFKFLKFRTISESSIAVVELQTGGIDATTSRMRSLSLYNDILTNPKFDGYMYSSLGGAIMGINMEGDWPTFFGGPGNFPLSQVWFRQAISHAINRTNLVENVYLGIAEEKRTIFPNWILSRFNNIDTTDYYDFDQGVAEAEAILDAMGYSPRKFSDEPDNRFGHGLYANETQINGVNQTKGRHFRIITMECDFCAPRVLAIQKDLRQIGVYLDIDIMEWGAYLTDLRYTADSGFDYNSTGPQPDPYFNGPNWDFSLGAFSGYYETPWNYIAYHSFVYWMYYGFGEFSWFNIDYEVAYAKATDGESFLWMDWPGSPTDWPYPIPKWSNDDPQFTDACEDAGDLLSYYLPKIPLIWYTETSVFDARLKNFLTSRSQMFHVAYSYWEGNEVVNSTTTTDSNHRTTTTTIPKISPFFDLSFLLGISLLLISISRNKKRK